LISDNAFGAILWGQMGSENLLCYLSFHRWQRVADEPETCVKEFSDPSPSADI